MKIIKLGKRQKNKIINTQEMQSLRKERDSVACKPTQPGEGKVMDMEAPVSPSGILCSECHHLESLPVAYEPVYAELKQASAGGPITLVTHISIIRGTKFNGLFQAPRDFSFSLKISHL